ncbi:MAG: hypothetical protein ACK5JT_01650 [Hyphomicrobiaceae bacterium]
MILATLAPESSNHTWVARRYLALHSLEGAELRLFEDFEQAFVALETDEVHAVLQLATLPSVGIAAYRLRGRIHLIDSFISTSQPMALLSRNDVANPTQLGLLQHTCNFVDTTKWSKLILESSCVAVGQGLLAGAYHAGVTLRRYAEENPDVLTIIEDIGLIDDAWLIWGRSPLPGDHFTAHPDSAAGLYFRRLGAPDFLH